MKESLAGSAVYRGALLIRNTPPVGPTVALCLGTYGDPRGVSVSYEQGTPVGVSTEINDTHRPYN